MSGTHVFYNGVLLRDCQLLRWQNIVEKSEAGSLLYVRHRIAVSSLLVPLLPLEEKRQDGVKGGHTPWFDNSQPPPLEKTNSSTIFLPRHGRSQSDTIGARYEVAQALLREPRKDFWIAFNSETPFELEKKKDAQGNTVYDNGPHEVPASEFNNNNSKKPYRILLAASQLDEIELAKTNDSRYLQQYLTGVERLGQPIGYPSPDLGSSGSEEFKIKKIDCLDLDNGPHPLEVIVKDVAGGQSIQVIFEIDICRLVNPDKRTSAEKYKTPPRRDASKCEGVINNTWTIVESTDEERKTTIEIVGSLTVSSHIYKPMAMRLMCQPLMIPYAKVTRRLSQDPSGLRLEYAFAMREVGIAPPPLVADWHGTYAQQSSVGGITHAYFQANLTGWVAPPYDSMLGRKMTIKEYKDYLRMILWRAAQSRLNYVAHVFGQAQPGVASNPGVIMQQVEIGEDITTNQVFIRAYAKLTDINTDIFGTKGNAFGNKIEFDRMLYDERWWPVPSAYPWDVQSTKEAYPYQDYGSFYDCYPQNPDSPYHGMPRGPIPPDTVARDAAILGGRTRGSGREVNSDVSIIVDPSLSPVEIAAFNRPYPGNSIGPGQQESVIDGGAFCGVSDNQFQDSTYLEWTSSDTYISDKGLATAALSGPRVLKASPTGSQGDLQPYLFHHTTIRLYAAQEYREVRVIAHRIDKQPIIPTEYPFLQTGANGRFIVHTLTDREVLWESPRPQGIGANVVCSAEVKMRYTLSRPIFDNILNSSGDNIGGDEFTILKDPRTKPIAQQNPAAVAVHDKIFNAGTGGLLADNKTAPQFNLNPDNRPS